MSSDNIAIVASQLSKCFPIYGKPKDRLKQYILPPLQGMMGFERRQYYKEYWALSDVSLEIKRGETVGIIGRNGAGKSTLLQILCGTLTPTSGSYRANGRIAALLELGSGFNPEFSGRENVYLNASILGLSREQIDQRFDAIAAFADIGEFIEEPVKTYSSGMYVRLAFAVIAHVDADILIVDEALAVGDAIFTQKCMRYIRSFQERGTLLFVSHDLGSVQNLCESAIWLDSGRIRSRGKSKKVSEEYLQFTLQALYGSDVNLQTQNIPESTASEKEDSSLKEEFEAGLTDIAEPKLANAEVLKALNTAEYEAHFEAKNNMFSANGFFTGDAEIVGIELKNLSPESIFGVFRGWDRVQLNIRVKVQKELARPIVGFLLRDRLGQDLVGENTLVATKKKSVSAQGGEELVASFEFILPMLKDGDYSIMCSIADGDLYNHVQHHWIHDALLVHVKNKDHQYGLVGVPFSRISLSKVSGHETR